MGEHDPFKAIIDEQLAAGADREQLLEIGYRDAADVSMSPPEQFDELGQLLGPDDEIDKLLETHNRIEIALKMGKIGATGAGVEQNPTPVMQPSAQVRRVQPIKKPVDRRRLTARQKLTADKIPYRPNN